MMQLKALTPFCCTKSVPVLQLYQCLVFLISCRCLFLFGVGAICRYQKVAGASVLTLGSVSQEPALMMF